MGLQLWYTEEHTENVRFSIKVKSHLFSEKSKFQQIDIFDSEEFGKFLTIDGLMMLTEKDEFIYHETIVHTPMAVHPDPKKVLVIGAGDGGVIRELTRYSSVKEIDLVEIDELVIKASKTYLPQTASKFNDPRVTVYIQDGLKFARSKVDTYDLIIVDSTDPIGPGEGLFTREFYGNCFNALKDDGVMVNQHESPFYKNTTLAMQRAHKRIKESFPIAMVYQAHIPTYPSGYWLFGFASKKYHPLDNLNQNWEDNKIETKYYNLDLHKGSFALPNYVKELLKNEEK